MIGRLVVLAALLTVGSYWKASTDGTAPVAFTATATASEGAAR